VTSLCPYTRTQPCLLLVHGFIDDALRKTVPSVNAVTFVRPQRVELLGNILQHLIAWELWAVCAK